MSKILGEFTVLYRSRMIPSMYVHTIHTKTHQLKNLESVSLFKKEFLDNIYKIYILL